MTFDDYMRNIEAEFEQEFSCKPAVDLAISPLELLQIADLSEQANDKLIAELKKREMDLLLANADKVATIAELRNDVASYQTDRWLMIIGLVWALIATAAAIHYAGVKL